MTSLDNLAPKQITVRCGDSITFVWTIGQHSLYSDTTGARHS